MHFYEIINEFGEIMNWWFCVYNQNISKPLHHLSLTKTERQLSFIEAMYILFTSTRKSFWSNRFSGQKNYLGQRKFLVKQLFVSKNLAWLGQSLAQMKKKIWVKFFFTCRDLYMSDLLYLLYFRTKQALSM